MKQIKAEVRNVIQKTTKTGKNYDLIIAEEEFGGGTHFISDWTTNRITSWPKQYVLIYNQEGTFKNLVDVRLPEDKPHPIEVMVQKE